MAKSGVLLVNLGTPAAPTTAAVRAYLREFLSDPLVVELPRLLWLPILYGVILPFRSKRSAGAYQKVWMDEGSPLLVQSQALTDALQQSFGAEVEVRLGMRYGQPSLQVAMSALVQAGCESIKVLPLYPQYARSTTQSTVDAIKVLQQRQFPHVALEWVAPYCEQPAYIEALAASIEQYWQQHGRADKLLLSFHGLPQKTVDNGDPYYTQCLRTASLLSRRLGLAKADYVVSFQSRLGKAEWLKPYTDHTLQQLAQSGVGSVQVVCPGFAVDCLETLEEIAMQNRDIFLEAGGESYAYIPALNADEKHVALLKQLLAG